MSQLKIALLQLTAAGSDQTANLHKGDEACRAAKAMGADIALFPEMWNIGYTPYTPRVWADSFVRDNPDDQPLLEAWKAQAVGADDAFIQHFRALAVELEMAIAITYLEKYPGQPRNTVSLIDRHGEIVLTYAKVHTCDFGLEYDCTPGDDFYVCPLDTAAGVVQVGAMICYDREFPESARILMLKGAEIILTPNACTLETNRLTQFYARAFENMVGLAMANYAAPQENGHSVALDGIAFEDGVTRDMTLVQADEREGIFIATFDLDQLRAYRESEAWGNSFRKPRTYTPLLSMDVQPPFVRAVARR